ncbi:hypothetical protein CQA53_03510 [Helicobacter didelphidarum]|uniref:Uncharacterized protein n=1 Tax=Helicobacter didelphidarum TaxID=2040648 RepID=A0A3D8IMT3_9HELI|nr:hypothetical protein [Helicobacter didelphidarum]RDU66522.1 hypothetical protein CQA53_03510 [Helicobacter didelphidarum]
MTIQQLSVLLSHIVRAGKFYFNRYIKPILDTHRIIVYAFILYVCFHATKVKLYKDLSLISVGGKILYVFRKISI